MSKAGPDDCWNAELLRLTVFPAHGVGVESFLDWKALVQATPQERNEQPQIGLLREVGALEGRSLTHMRHPARIDWLLESGAADDDLLGSPKVRPFREQLAAFQPLMNRWLEDAPALKRIAFGAVLLLPVADRSSGYRRLVSFLGDVGLDPDKSSDFLYQINRPKPSKNGPAGLKINRLTKWSVAATQRGILTLGASVDSQQIGPVLHACRLEVDMNTSADYEGTLSSRVSRAVFEELVTLAQEIADHGGRQ